MPPVPLIFRENKQHVLDWIAHNPIFETTNKVKRELRKDNQGKIVLMLGVPVDVSRGYQDIKKNIWQQGDYLSTSGPPLCGEDAKSYLTCLYLLEQRNFSTMCINFTASKFMDALALEQTRDNWVDTQRSLVRLAMAHIFYKLKTGDSYSGSLSFFDYRATSSIDGVYSISFIDSVTPRFSSIQKGTSTTFLQDQNDGGGCEYQR